LKPASPLLAAKMYTANKLFDVGPFYSLLMNQDPEKDAVCVEKYEGVLEKWLLTHAANGRLAVFEGLIATCFFCFARAPASIEC
jgi:hypothetical protein